MMIESPALLQYIIPEDIYLLKGEAFIDATHKDELSPVAMHNAQTAFKQEPVIEPKVEKEQPPIIEAKAAIAFNYLGGNRQKFVLLAYYTIHPYMDQKHLEALTNILQRKNLAIDDVAIVNIAQHKNLLADDLIEYFKPTRMVFLGDECIMKGFNHVTINRLTDVGTIKVLYTHSFSGMMDDVEKKKAFWEQMKVL